MTVYVHCIKTRIMLLSAAAYSKAWPSTLEPGLQHTWFILLAAVVYNYFYKWLQCMELACWLCYRKPTVLFQEMQTTH